MRSSQLPPKYPHRPIQQLQSLARVLGIPLPVLQSVASTASARYRLAKPIEKPDGSIRQPVDALQPLKNIQRRIKERILDSVVFPDYLTGSLKGKDSKRNAELHERPSMVLCEDIQGFFPNTTSSLVGTVWRGFFGFSPEVSELLTALTTKDGGLPEGATTSSHLANLVFWRKEHALYESLRAERRSYSRYVDDVAISSATSMTKEEVTRCIARVYGMMLGCGYKAKRKKQEIQRAHMPMRVTKLNVNRRVTLASRERQAIRTAVYQLEQRASSGDLAGASQSLNSVAGRVNRMGQMHPAEALGLKERLKALRKALTEDHQ
jgi:hypothetical protein